MTEYKFDAVRWCKSRARSARAQRNFADENSFVQVAREIEELMARLAEAEAQRDGLAERIGVAVKMMNQGNFETEDVVSVLEKALAKLEEK